jgi:hypothetical protein
MATNKKQIRAYVSNEMMDDMDILYKIWKSAHGGSFSRFVEYILAKHVSSRLDVLETYRLERKRVIEEIKREIKDGV